MDISKMSAAEAESVYEAAVDRLSELHLRPTEVCRTIVECEQRMDALYDEAGIDRKPWEQLEELLMNANEVLEHAAPSGGPTTMFVSAAAVERLRVCVEDIEKERQTRLPRVQDAMLWVASDGESPDCVYFDYNEAAASDARYLDAFAASGEKLQGFKLVGAKYTSNF